MANIQNDKSTHWGQTQENWSDHQHDVSISLGIDEHGSRGGASDISVQISITPAEHGSGCSRVSGERSNVQAFGGVGHSTPGSTGAGGCGTGPGRESCAPPRGLDGAHWGCGSGGGSPSGGPSAGGTGGASAGGTGGPSAGGTRGPHDGGSSLGGVRGGRTGAAGGEDIAANPNGGAQWYTGDAGTLAGVSEAANRAASSGQAALYAFYDIPKKDLAGGRGASSEAEYLDHARQFARATQGAPGYVVLEPDALAQSASLSPGDAEDRFRMMREAAEIMKQENPDLKVILDLGNSGWMSADQMGKIAKESGLLDYADGFATNVSNFRSTEREQQYGEQIRNIVGDDMVQLIDTSRNGGNNSPSTVWNPSDWAPGRDKGWLSANTLALAIKPPGEAD